MISLIDLTGTESTLTPTLANQQVSILVIAPGNPNFSVGYQMTNQGVFLKRGTSQIVFPLSELLKLAVGSVPGLTYPPLFTGQPINQTVVTGDTAEFSVNAVAQFDSPTYQWQVSTNSGASWSNLSNDAVYDGVTTSVLHVTPPDISYDNFMFRAVATSAIAAQSTNSQGATLTVTIP